MLAELRTKRALIENLCVKYSVKRLEVFGSAAREVDFDHAQSDADFLVTFAPSGGGLLEFAEFKDALSELLGRPVDLIERVALEQSRNYIRRDRILGEAEPVYG